MMESICIVVAKSECNNPVLVDMSHDADLMLAFAFENNFDLDLNLTLNLYLKANLKASLILKLTSTQNQSVDIISQILFKF